MTRPRGAFVEGENEEGAGGLKRMERIEQEGKQNKVQRWATEPVL